MTRRDFFRRAGAGLAAAALASVSSVIPMTTRRTTPGSIAWAVEERETFWLPRDQLGEVRYVTNNHDDGPGSLREALQSDCRHVEWNPAPTPTPENPFPMVSYSRSTDPRLVEFSIDWADKHRDSYTAERAFP